MEQLLVLELCKNKKVTMHHIRCLLVKKLLNKVDLHVRINTEELICNNVYKLQKAGTNTAALAKLQLGVLS